MESAFFVRGNCKDVWCVCVSLRGFYCDPCETRVKSSKWIRLKDILQGIDSSMAH